MHKVIVLVFVRAVYFNNTEGNTSLITCWSPSSLVQTFCGLDIWKHLVLSSYCIIYCAVLHIANSTKFQWPRIRPKKCKRIYFYFGLLFYGAIKRPTVTSILHGLRPRVVCILKSKYNISTISKYNTKDNQYSYVLSLIILSMPGSMRWTP